MHGLYFKSVPTSHFNMNTCYIPGISIYPKIVLFLVIYVYHAEKACSETLIAGQNVTLLCSLPSLLEAAVWIDKTDAKFSNTLSRCEAGEQKCDKNPRYETGDLHHLALRNATFSWITVSSYIPGNYTITCNSGDDHVLQTFILTFIDANMFQNPRCDVFPYENDTSKVKFECEMDTRGVGAVLEILGAGENIKKSPDFVYIILDYDHFINTSDVTCHMGIKGITISCVFPRGIRINHITEGDDAIFKINANFEIDDLMIDWQLVKIDKIDVETTQYSLWFDEKHTSMFFHNVSSITGTEGIIVRCELTQMNDENHNTSEVIGIGFVDLDGHEIELNLDSHDDNNNTNTSGGYLCNIGNQETHRNQRNVVLTYVFLGLWLTSSIGLIAGLIGHVRKQT